MSVYLKKEEVLDKVKQYETSTLHFFQNNGEGICYVTLINERDEEEFKGLLTASEGMKFLLDYCIWRKSFSLEASLDTISITDKSRELGYIRIQPTDHIVKSYPRIVEEFLLQMILLYRYQYGKLRIDYNTNYLSESTIVFLGDGTLFQVISKDTQVERIKYLFQKFISIYKDVIVEETDEWYGVDQVVFSKKAFGSDEKEFFQKTINTNPALGYIEGKPSSLIFELYRSVQQESFGRRFYKKK